MSSRVSVPLYVLIIRGTGNAYVRLHRKQFMLQYYFLKLSCNIVLYSTIWTHFFLLQLDMKFQVCILYIECMCMYIFVHSNQSSTSLGLCPDRCDARNSNSSVLFCRSHLSSPSRLSSPHNAVSLLLTMLSLIVFCLSSSISHYYW